MLTKLDPLSSSADKSLPNTNMSISPVDAAIYVRMTFRQLKIDPSFKFTKTHRRLGCYIPGKQEIHVSAATFKNFDLFREVLLHEIAHYFDHMERGNFRGNGRKNVYHGKNWKKWCLTLGIRPRRLIPA